MSFKAAKKPFEVRKGNVRNIVDTFILLSNSDNLMKQIADEQLDSLIGVIDVKGNDELETQATVLITQIQQSRLPPLDEEVKKEEEQSDSAQQ